MPENFVIAALYHFTPLQDIAGHQASLRECFADCEIKGTVLLADEGINGTIAGTRAGVDTALAALRALPGCAGFEHKESYAEVQPFLRMKVRLKKEIVALGVPGVSPTKAVGKYIDPSQWNDILNDPEYVIIDTRNDYEVAIGTFQGAVNPKTETFRDFPAWFRKFKRKTNKTKVAMFCTGGIRCEKSTALLIEEGVKDVVHLKGGILKYLETVDEAKSQWNGECFVFDARVSVGHGLVPGTYHQCFACRRPIDDEMMAHAHYLEGVSCPQCFDEYDETRKRAFAERQKQIRLAAERGEQHIGQAAAQKPSSKEAMPKESSAS